SGRSALPRQSGRPSCTHRPQLRDARAVGGARRTAPVRGRVCRCDRRRAGTAHRAARPGRHRDPDPRRPVTEATAPFRAVFAGRRGRLLAGFLLAEFAGAVGVIAYGSVLPLAARDLHGGSLYGATLAAGTLTTILILASGFTVRPARRALFV